MTEYELIRSIASKFRRSKLQKNGVFESDAEIIEIGGKLWGLTMDDFSPEEDLFTSNDPYTLGSNLATATISDLLSSGVKPEFFMHAISLPEMCDLKFINAVTDGIKDVLEKSGCFLCGGDIGRSVTWRYCGFAMGPVISEKPISRILPDRNQTLWVTGTLGDANLAAFSSSATPKFELRLPEAAFIRKYASGCVDTSGGFLDALWILEELNPSMKIEIHAGKLPYCTGLASLSRLKNIPIEAGLTGGAGEYELLFSTDAELPAPALEEIKTLHVSQIGTVHAANGNNTGIYFSKKDSLTVKLEEPPPSPRNFSTLNEYVNEVIRLSYKITGSGKQ
ncbi:MAG: AIR synthase related protein [Victivallales bacterium]